MTQSWITVHRPASAAPKGYDEEGGRPGVIWRLQLPLGASREIEIAGLGSATTITLQSNDPSVVTNAAFTPRRQGDRWVATVTGAKIGTTLITVGFTAPTGLGGMPAMPITPDWGPVILQVQVTRADGTMPGTGNDRGVPPEGQIDAMACWAACLAWWTRANPHVTTRTQLSLIGASAGQTLANGSINAATILSFFASQSAMKAERIAPDKLVKYIAARRFPMIIGFSSGPLGGHVNVIHGYNEAKGTVTVMEPWFPDPDRDAAYVMDTSQGLPVYISRKDPSKTFVFKGAHLDRPLAYYTAKPLAGYFVVAYSSAGPGIRVD